MTVDTSNQPNSPPSPLHRLWDRLTTPSPHLTDVDDQHKARLLASMLVVLIPLGLGFSVLPSLLGQTAGLTQDPIFYLGVLTCIVLGAAYGLSRTTRYQIGTIIALAVIFLTVSAAAILDNDATPGLMAFLLIPIVLACMLLPIRVVTALIVLSLVLIAIAPQLIGQTSLADVLTGAFALTLIVSIMLIMLLEYRDRVEQQRRLSMAASEARYRQLVEASPDMIAVQRQGKFLFVNSAGIKLLGARSMDDLLALPPYALIPDSERAQLAQAQRLTNFETPHRVEFKIKRIDGQLIEVEGTSILIEYLGAPATQIIIRDITARRLAEEALQFYAARLELLHNIDHAILTSDQVSELADRALEQLYKFIPYRRAGILLFHFAEGTAEFIASMGLPVAGFAKGARIPLDTLRSLDQIRNGDHAIIPDIGMLDPLTETHHKLIAAGIRSYIIMPLMAHGVLIGSINLGMTNAAEITGGAVALLHEIGDQIRHRL